MTDFWAECGDKAVDDYWTQDFYFEMRGKLKRSREQKGRGGWYLREKVSIAELWAMLEAHVKKGDPVDIANFAMMIWARNKMGRCDTVEAT